MLRELPPKVPFALSSASSGIIPQPPLPSEDPLSHEVEAPHRRLTRDDLLMPFLSACKPSSAFLVGTEAEKFGVRRVGGQLQPLPFEGPASVGAVLAALAERFDYKPYRETPDGEIIALLGDRQSITLEPAGQLELSGAPLRTIHETQAEFQRHLEELKVVSEPLGITWLSLGFHPFARQDELPHVPKLRYSVMEHYLPTRGTRALDMMRRTCTVQANLDYLSPDDAMRKLHIALALQPVFTGMFANSPWYEGTRRGLLSERADVWLHMDPDRSGLLPFAWEAEAALNDYIEWALSAPMFMIRRGSKLIKNTGQTFREFMKDGYGGVMAQPEDWDTHLNSLFPEVRLKRTLEVRGADAQQPDLLCAIPALWKGLLYDAKAMDDAAQLAERLSYQAVEHVRPQIARAGLKASLAGKQVQWWAEAMLDIARSGLDRIALRDQLSRSESEFLTSLQTLVARGKTPAEVLLEQAGDTPSRDVVVQATAI